MKEKGSGGGGYLGLSKTLSAALLSVLGASAGNTESLTEVLREWTAQNIYAANDMDGHPKLFVRTQPVRAHIKSAAPFIVPELQGAIEALSAAFQLPHDFVSRDPNLIIAVASPIADANGRPNRVLLRELGLPDVAINMIKEDWSSGCGSYVFGSRSAKVSASVIVAETHREPDQMRNCLLTGLLNGFGLSIKPKTLINTAHGYVQYLVSARALRSCGQLESEDTSNASLKSVEDKYASCAANFMNSIFRSGRMPPI